MEPKPAGDELAPRRRNAEEVQMTRRVEIGVFMPVGSNGFMMSNRTPRYEPTFALHRDIAIRAEQIGLDYVFWMGKWKGYDGTSGYWKSTLEPMSLAGAIAGVTSRVKLFATISPLLFHPAVAAKMISTIDGVSGGRFGINVVTGNTLTSTSRWAWCPRGTTRSATPTPTSGST